MTIMHEINTCDGALVEMTVGDITIYSYNREQWYTDLIEVLRDARRYWEWKLIINPHPTIIPNLYLAKIDKRLGELLPQA